MRFQLDNNKHSLSKLVENVLVLSHFAVRKIDKIVSENKSSV